MDPVAPWGLLNPGFWVSEPDTFIEVGVVKELRTSQAFLCMIPLYPYPGDRQIMLSSPLPDHTGDFRSMSLMSVHRKP